MNGFFGTFDFSRCLSPQTVEKAVEKMLQASNVDAKNFWEEEGVSLAHLMHWNTPESFHEKLPFQKGNLVITGDIRIDNQIELLQKLDLAFLKEEKLVLDSTLVLLAYEKWGRDCPEHLLGDFAFVLWDREKRELFCARDHMGVRHLFFTRSSQFFAFSSEVKGLLALPEVRKQVDEEQLARCLAGVGINHQESFFQGISLLPAGQALLVTAQDCQQWEYWAPESKPPQKFRDDQEVFEAFQEIFAEAVRCRLRSAYPVGSMLSGGLDSSSISCVAARELRKRNQKLLTFSSVLSKKYQGSLKDERYFIEKVVEQEKVDPIYIETDHLNPFENLEQSIFSFEAPNVTFFHSLYSSIYQKAKEKQVRVILDGVGGEISGATSDGPGYLAQLFLQGKWGTVFQQIYKQSQAYGVMAPRLFLQELLPVFFPKSFSFYQRWRSGSSRAPWHFSPASSSFRQKMERELGYPLKRKLKPAVPNLKINEVAAATYARKAKTKLSEPYQLDIRFPFLDKRVVEFCLSLPGNFKIRDGWKRYLIRQGMEGILPSEIQWRPTKSPFFPAYPEQFNKFHHEALKILEGASPQNEAFKYIDVNYVQKIFQQSQSLEQTWKIKPHLLREAVHQSAILITFFSLFQD